MYINSEPIQLRGRSNNYGGGLHARNQAQNKNSKSLEKTWEGKAITLNTKTEQSTLSYFPQFNIVQILGQ